MTYPSLSLTLGLSVQPVLKPKGFEDADGHCLPLKSGRMRTRTDVRTPVTTSPANEGHGRAVHSSEKSSEGSMGKSVTYVW
jgi:hypothetical protein